jgi:hydroxymethylpyrimidine pyrophosphatase-like HAD family hydrolase
MGETAAFGNSENDVSMLREAGWSYAVSNAEPAALAAARFHIESNDRDGVARVLETFL